MGKNKTISVRAPKHMMQEMRLKFPELTDSAIIGIGLRTSLLRAEGGLRERSNEKDRKKTKKLTFM